MPEPVIFPFEEAVSICCFLGKCQCGAGAGLCLLGLVCVQNTLKSNSSQRALSPVLCSPNGQVRAMQEFKRNGIIHTLFTLKGDNAGNSDSG